MYGPPPTHYVTLDNDRLPVTRNSVTPAVAVIRASVPDLIDRPQLVFRTAGNYVTLSEQYRWAEPLRYAIPRLIANDLGELFDSSHIAAEHPVFPVDFKLTLDFQQLNAVSGKGVDVDVLWRLDHRNGKSIVGHACFRQPLAETASDLIPLVAAQRQALRRIATEVAKQIEINQ